MPSTYVITGAARGIGHELVKQLLAAGHTVVATTRKASPALSLMSEANDGRLIVLFCDLASVASVQNFGIELAKKVSQVDVLVNNAGICTPPADEDPSNLKPNIVLEQFQTNVIGTLLVTQAIAPLFHAGTKVVNISSMVGSFSITKGMPLPSVPSYSLSKVGLNMLTLKQALFYADQVVVALDPGLVKTDMNPNGPHAVEDVAASMIGVIDGLKEEDSATFVSWEGKSLNW